MGDPRPSAPPEPPPPYGYMQVSCNDSSFASTGQQAPRTKNLYMAIAFGVVLVVALTAISVLVYGYVTAVGDARKAQEEAKSLVEEAWKAREESWQTKEDSRAAREKADELLEQLKEAQEDIRGLQEKVIQVQGEANKARAEWISTSDEAKRILQKVEDTKKDLTATNFQCEEAQQSVDSLLHDISNLKKSLNRSTFSKSTGASTLSSGAGCKSPFGVVVMMAMAKWLAR